MGGGGLQPMSQAILLETFPPEQRGLAMGIFGMGAVLGPILGPLLGGWLTDNYSWRWIFYINLPICLIALVLISTFVFDPTYQERRGQGEKVDYPGIVLLTVGLGSLQIVLDKGQRDDWFNSHFILTLSTVSAVCLIVLVFWELNHERPILDLRIFRERTFATGNVVMFFSFFAFYGSVVLLPLYLQTVMGYTAFLAGVVLGPGAVLTLVTLPIAGKLTERIDARALLAFGLLATAYSVYYMSGFNNLIDFRTASTGRLIQGIGMPFIFVCATYVTMAYVPKREDEQRFGYFQSSGKPGIVVWHSLCEHHARVAVAISSIPVDRPLYRVQSAIGGTPITDALVPGIQAESLARRRPLGQTGYLSGAPATSDRAGLQRRLFFRGHHPRYHGLHCVDHPKAPDDPENGFAGSLIRPQFRYSYMVESARMARLASRQNSDRELANGSIKDRHFLASSRRCKWQIRLCGSRVICRSLKSSLHTRNGLQTHSLTGLLQASSFCPYTAIVRFHETRAAH